MATKKIINDKVTDIISEDNQTAKIDLTASTPGIKIDDSILVKVKSNTFGQLIYINKKNGDETVWSKAGEVQTMYMGDLRAMKANQIAFFQNQWIIILGVDDASECPAKPADIYKALAITTYYKSIVEPTDFGAVCGWSIEDIKSKVALMSDGAKANLIIALNEYISRGILESLSKIKAFEKELGCGLTRPE